MSDEQDTAGSAQENVDEERVRAVVDELRRLRVEDLALDMAVSLVTVGYQKLGLTEQTRELRDLDGARLSIELLRACLDVLERERGVAGLDDLRGTLSTMQLNFARVVADEQATEQARQESDAESGCEDAHQPGADPAATSGSDSPAATGIPADE
jgi:hypothetical protein